MMAIPIFRTRVAPVLDWCSKILIVPEEAPDMTASREIGVQETGRFELMRTLRKQGIDTVICGALSPEMLNYGESLGLRIIHGIAGDIGEVLQAYRKGELDRPRYWLPGCRGQRRYKGSAKCAGEAESPAPRPGNTATGGPGGFCICPRCGATAPHERGIPCSQLRCPGCSAAMTRKIGN
ncbi:MAG: NifB/NifX family molybdenum-iron cluster-binding protein [Syntrophobacteraceae bacterium]